MTKRWKNRPEGSNWGDFGPDDERGRLNLITRQTLPKTETEKVQRHKIAHVSGAVIDLNERAQSAAHRDDPGQQV